MLPNCSISTWLCSAIVAWGPTWARARGLSNASPSLSTLPPVNAVATHAAGSTPAAYQAFCISATEFLAALMLPVAQIQLARKRAGRERSDAVRGDQHAGPEADPGRLHGRRAHRHEHVGVEHLRVVEPRSSVAQLLGALDDLPGVRRRREADPEVHGGGETAPVGGRSQAAVPSVPRRPASESERLCHGNGGHEWGACRRRALMLPILPVCGRKDRARNLPTTTGCLPAPRAR